MNDRDYRWLYLCSDPRRLAITLRSLPSGAFAHLDNMTVLYCSHLDGPTHRRALVDTASQWAPSWLNVKVQDATPFGKYLPDGVLQQYFAHPKKRWGLGVKLTLPWIADGPYLYTDDDVLVPQDPWLVMREHIDGFGTSGNFKFFKGSTRLEPFARELMSVIGHGQIANAGALYDRYILDAGIWFDCLAMTTSWETQLKKFAALPYLQNVKVDSHEFRRIDQRFLTLYGIEHDWYCLTRSFERRNCYSHPTKFTLSSVAKGTGFVHYKTGRHKADWMTALELVQGFQLQRTT